MYARYRIIIVVLSLLGFASTAFSGGQVPPKKANRSTTTFSEVFEIVDPGSLNSSLGPKIDAATMLVRRNDGAGMSFNTKRLLPDAPYTAWWVVFNKPRQCLVPCECGFPDVFDPVQAAAAKTSVFWATGRMTDGNGQATFSAQIGLNDLPSGDDQVVFGSGLLSPRAEIHLVTRAHGPALGTDEQLEEQLTKFNGGCNPDCFDAQVSVHRSPTCKTVPYH